LTVFEKWVIHLKRDKQKGLIIKRDRSLSGVEASCPLRLRSANDLTLNCPNLGSRKMAWKPKWLLKIKQIIFK